MSLAVTPPIIKLSPIENPCKITLLEPIHNYNRLSLHNSTLKWI